MQDVKAPHMEDESMDVESFLRKNVAKIDKAIEKGGAELAWLYRYQKLSPEQKERAKGMMIMEKI